ncbi:MAG: Fe-S cluster biogenesis protein NfuA [Candidatus Marivariicella framensis]|jgi:Fe-S cluster biogenesis protein NfuA|tara:strand:- start:1193 stop:2080 length:888 start_codon:yes stop_codon:yes gene_type:complete
MESFNINAKSELGNPIAHFQIDKPLGVPYSKKFNNIDDAQDSPLVQKLFYLPFVKSVTLNNQSILIERFNILEWEEVIEEVNDQIKNYLNSGEVVLKSDFTEKKVPISIYAESTPNPSVMKFVANKKLVETNVEYKNIEDAKGASLAIELFNLPYVKEVFVSENYISITKFDLTEWDPIIQEIRGLIVKGLEQKKVLFNLIKIDNSKSEVENTNLTDIDKKIISILDEYIQPAVASDGGSIVFDSYIPESQSVNVILQGACSGCPSSTLTLKNGIENMLKEMMPGLVENVTAING